MTYGYAGQTLHIDLTSRRVETELIDIEKEKRFIGGFGSCFKIASENARPYSDPLSEENPIVFSAGVLTGTSTPGASKVTAVTKLPQTNAFGWSQGSLAFGPHLKWAGYDHVVVKGKSAEPVYLEIIDGDVRICEARHLWGKDIFESTIEMKRGRVDGSVACIGQAGENLVKSSLAMIDSMATLGQGGLGAVMGSKKLKGIYVYGSKGIKIANKTDFLRLIRGLSERMVSFGQRDQVINLGLMAGWNGLIKNGFVTTKYMTEAQVSEVYGIDEYRKRRVKCVSCPSCLVGDKEVVRFNEGRYEGLTLPVTSYQAIASFGAKFRITDASEAAYLLGLCNRYGVSAQTLDGLLDFFIDLVQAGLVDEREVGFAIKRDFSSVKTLIEMIVHREGIGDLLADGWAAVVNHFGQECARYAYITKGSNFIWEPRMGSLGTMQFAQLVSPKGPYSAFGGSPTTVAGLDKEFMRRHCDRVGASREQIDQIFDSAMGLNIGRMTRCFENWVTLMTCLGICNRAQNDRYYSAKICAELYSAATGIETNSEMMITATDRIWTLIRAINAMEGFTRKDDVVPEQWFEPLKLSEGDERVINDYFRQRVLNRKQIDEWLDDYYISRGWDVLNGVPKKETLLSLGLQEMVPADKTDSAI